MPLQQLLIWKSNCLLPKQFVFQIYVVVNFSSQVIFVFLLFLGMVMYANEVDTKEKWKLPEIKIYYNIYISSLIFLKASTILFRRIWPNPVAFSYPQIFAMSSKVMKCRHLQLSWLSLSEWHNGILSKRRKLALESSLFWYLRSFQRTSFVVQESGAAEHKTSKY